MKTLQPTQLKRESEVNVRNRRLTFLFPPFYPHFIPEMTGIRESNDSDRTWGGKSRWDSILGDSEEWLTCMQAGSPHSE